MPFFKIKKLSPFLDGLVVEGDMKGVTVRPCLHVSRIINDSIVVGDRNLSYPVAPYSYGSLTIDPEFLTELKDYKIREFDHTNPWGKCLFECGYNKGQLQVACARYELATQVTVTEKQGKRSKTLFTGYFRPQGGDETGEHIFDEVKDTVESHLKGEYDIDDMIFELKELQEG